MERLELAEVLGEASGSGYLLFQDARDRRSPCRAARGSRVAVLLLAGASYNLGCCNVADPNWFETKKGKGKCLKNCIPSTSQLFLQTQPIMDPILAGAEWYGPSLYSFAVVMQDYGSTKKMYDLELLQEANEKVASIFRCEKLGVFSDRDGHRGSGASPVKPGEDADGDFHLAGLNWFETKKGNGGIYFAKSEEPGTWLSTLFFACDPFPFCGELL